MSRLAWQAEPHTATMVVRIQAYAPPLWQYATATSLTHHHCGSTRPRHRLRATLVAVRDRAIAYAPPLWQYATAGPLAPEGVASPGAKRPVTLKMRHPHVSLREDVDPVIEVYKKDVDRSLLRENLKLTVAQRLEKLQAQYDFYEKMQAARKAAREP